MKLIHIKLSSCKVCIKLIKQLWFTYSEATSPGISDSNDSNFAANRSKIGSISTRYI